MNLHRLSFFSLLMLSLLTVPIANAQEQEQAHQHLPVAFRTWPNQTVSIETYWGFKVAIGPDADKVPGIDEPDLTMGGAGLEVAFGQEGEVGVSWWDGEEKQGLARVRAGQSYSVVLDRKPNEAAAAFIFEQGQEPTANAVYVRIWTPEGHGPVALIEADGVVVIYGSPASLRALKGDDLNKPLNVAVVVVGDDVAALDASELKTLGKHLAADSIYVAGSARIVGEIWLNKEVGNTTALQAGAGYIEHGPVLLEHADEPWPLPKAMAALYDDLDATSRKWTPVFEALSVNQMNHKPANGTHTPRWNIEHMASRQMFFITAAYHAADERFPHIRLDPSQMPPDYIARHPDWDGAEEARRVYRTTAFLRRFAYVYHGRDLDAPIAPNSRIRFAPIMRQVTRHWGDHTPKVQDKMKQDDWPAE